MKFRGLDRLGSWAPRQWILGDKAVSFEEFTLAERFGGEPCLPTGLLLQAGVDLASWLVMLSTDFQGFWLPREVGPTRFLAPLRPGGRAVIRVEVSSWSTEGQMICRISAHQGEKQLLAGEEWAGQILPLEKFRNPDDMRVLFSEIQARESRS
jgi:3-hydroxymyristoyl/3-hydroxydecanoyl-(acyl carrier protein) dehydratase